MLYCIPTAESQYLFGNDFNIKRVVNFKFRKIYRLNFEYTEDHCNLLVITATAILTLDPLFDTNSELKLCMTQNGKNYSYWRNKQLFLPTEYLGYAR